MKFTYYWRDGRREVLDGDDPADAMNKRGYGNGALRALDFYSRGENDEYHWEAASREWRRTATLVSDSAVSEEL